MQERVGIIEGKKSPIIFVAPHGANDDYTGEMAETAARAIRAYAVINWGWERSDKVDWGKDKANCNDVRQVQEDVVKDEFLDPILRYCVRIQKNFDTVYVFMLHGMGYQVDTHVIVGYGAGTPDSFSCKTWHKNYLCHLIDDIGLKVWQGKAGGQYSGWGKNNLNQLWRKHPEYYDESVMSMQLEISKSLRNTEANARLHAEYLAAVCDEIPKTKSWYPSRPQHIAEY
jgi:hypothetical protein